MAEYIEREAAMDIFGDAPMWQGYYEPYPWEVHCALVGTVKLVKEEISKIPAADVAPVVRCKDCLFWERDIGFCHYHSRYYDGGASWDIFNEDDFCSYGERKEND